MDEIQPHIRLYTKFQNHPLYPAGRRFTEFEAWLDLLAQCHPTGRGHFASIAGRWGWENIFERALFKKNLEKLGLITAIDPGEGGDDNEEAKGLIQINKHELWYEAKPVPPAAPQPKEEKVSVEECQKIIDAFNTIIGRKIKYTPERYKLIRDRCKSSTKSNPINYDSFVAVFENRKAVWSGDKEMEKHLEFETLLRPKHFQKYLDAARDAWRKKKNSAPAPMFNPTNPDQ